MNNSQLSLPGAAPQADAVALRDFLTRHVSPHIHIMSKAPDAEGFPGWYFGDDVEGAIAKLEAETRAGRNCYWTPNLTSVAKKPKRDEITVATRAHVDVDPPAGDPSWSARDVAKRMVEDGASLVNFSGNGVQGFWNLDTPTDDFDAVEAINKGLIERYGGDTSCFPVSHAMRLPGTVNFPDAGKRAKGRTVAATSVLHEVDKRHSLHALRMQFPYVAPVAGTFDFAQPLPEHFHYSKMSDDQIIADLCADPKLAALWNGDASAHSDRSEADFQLACALIERARTPERAVKLFNQSGLDPAKDPERAKKKGRDYVARTTRKALESAWTKEPSYIFRDFKPGPLPAGATIIPFPAPSPAPVTVSLPQLVAASSFAGKPVPERQWIVEPLVPQGYVTDLTADGGTGKSLLALQLGVARATGTNWIGFPAKQGATIYLAAEDDVDELHRRLADICRETGTSLDALDDLHILPLFGEDARLAGLTGRDFQATPLYNHLHTLIASVQAGLIIIDTRADTFGGDEVNRAQVMQFVALLKKMANDHDATVLLISHPSRTGQSLGDGQSGSTAWGNAVRSRLYLKREDDNTLTLATKKANYGPNDTQVNLEWRKGCFVSLGNTTDPFYRIEIEGKAQKRFLELLTEANLAGTNVSAHLTSVNGAPAVFHKMDKTISKDHYRDAMRRLMQTGQVVLEDYRYDGKDRQRLKIASPA